jgi:hypothetical protein
VTPIEALVWQEGPQQGVDPAVAIAVFEKEGGVYEWAKPGDFNSNGVPSSFGPGQLHYGGLGEPHSAAGLGDEFTAETGLDARDPANGPAAVVWTLRYAARHGWTKFHGWTGDPWAGIGAAAGVVALTPDNGWQVAVLGLVALAAAYLLTTR